MEEIFVCSKLVCAYCRVIDLLLCRAHSVTRCSQFAHGLQCQYSSTVVFCCVFRSHHVSCSGWPLELTENELNPYLSASNWMSPHYYIRFDHTSAFLFELTGIQSLYKSFWNAIVLRVQWKQSLNLCVVRTIADQTTYLLLLPPFIMTDCASLSDSSFVFLARST